MVEKRERGKRFYLLQLHRCTCKIQDYTRIQMYNRVIHIN